MQSALRSGLCSTARRLPLHTGLWQANPQATNLASNLTFVLPAIPQDIALQLPGDGYATTEVGRQLPSYQPVAWQLPSAGVLDAVPCWLPTLPLSDGIGSIMPFHCGGQHWFRIIKNQRDIIKGYQNAGPADCGPRKRHWKWYRDKRIAMKRKRRVI
mmetsp:Transcript_26028/g.45318  ORF Transcript_26028/g.45318 Transcript_26028/m.45318 type:complete len:157 (+) Transcript_26028:62-532(+)